MCKALGTLKPKALAPGFWGLVYVQGVRDLNPKVPKALAPGHGARGFAFRVESLVSGFSRLG